MIGNSFYERIQAKGRRVRFTLNETKYSGTILKHWMDDFYLVNVDNGFTWSVECWRLYYV